MGGTLKKNDYDTASNNNTRAVGMSPISLPPLISLFHALRQLVVPIIFGKLKQKKKLKLKQISPFCFSIQLVLGHYKFNEKSG